MAGHVGVDGNEVAIVVEWKKIGMTLNLILTSTSTKILLFRFGFISLSVTG